MLPLLLLLAVGAMARTLLAGQNVLYDGDPLRDLTLGAFLEKFVQKKAKVGGVWCVIGHVHACGKTEACYPCRSSACTLS